MNHMSMILKGKYAYIADLTALLDAASQDCNLYIASQTFYMTHVAFATRKDFPYEKIFTQR